MRAISGVEGRSGAMIVIVPLFLAVGVVFSFKPEPVGLLVAGVMAGGSLALIIRLSRADIDSAARWVGIILLVAMMLAISSNTEMSVVPTPRPVPSPAAVFTNEVEPSGYMLSGRAVPVTSAPSHRALASVVAEALDAIDAPGDVSGAFSIEQADGAPVYVLNLYLARDGRRDWCGAIRVRASGEQEAARLIAKAVERRLLQHASSADACGAADGPNP